ncbi:MAG: M48 family metallopeptidase, partial [Anaerolineae bacterium]|nr:M48 family metallopeptidase [Anaerolineae bacterium]
MIGRRRSVRPYPVRGRSAGKMRLLMALVMVIIAVVSYCGSKQYNPITDEDQYLSITENQEIALGLQAAPQMIQQYGGLYPEQALQDRVDQIGFHIVENSAARDTPWQYEFHVLNDPETINAFALPGGQIFITTALLNQLETEGQLAGILGHEIGHVVARHSAQRIAQSELTQGLIGAVAVGASDVTDPRVAAQVASMIGNLVNMKFGRGDELQSDELGVLFMSQAGYDPRSMIGVMEILAQAGGGGPPEFFNTHPNPDNRILRIQEAIQEV